MYIIAKPAGHILAFMFESLAVNLSGFPGVFLQEKIPILSICIAQHYLLL